MAKKKAAGPIVAAKVAIWFCDDEHLHVEMMDEDENVVAEIALDFEDGVQVVNDLVESTGYLLVDPDDLESDDDDEIGPTLGNA